jgi:DNA polymerase I-like protein with 3'-5' exonuclease and polymerase domains
MEAAYEREKLLAPILHQASIRGIRCNVDALADDLQFYECVLLDCDVAIRKYLKAPHLNIDSDTDLAAAMDAMGLIDNWEYTPTGRKSTSKKSMAKMLAGSPLTAILNYRASLSTCVNTFMGPWLELASHTGRVYPTWNQTRQAEKGGARTGRVTCQDPNLTNVSKEFPNPPPEGYPPLPLMRSYLLPEEGHVWCRRDYQQQELRILAHYEDGEMMEAYRANPRIDFHNLAQQLIEINTGISLERKAVKIIAFSIIYGAGALTMAERMGCAPSDAQALKNAYYEAIPGIRIVQNEIRNLVRQSKPIRTWGGRLYFCEEPWVDPKTGKQHTYEYKLLNYLVQGSAGDCTKEAILNYDRACTHGTFMTQVYDEMNISCPPEYVPSEMQLLAECMADVKFDVPMLSDGSVGPNYQQLEEFRDESQ